jgi:metal-dependent amidase/aminoacylase/carboxypeptidase family protein
MIIKLHGKTSHAGEPDRGINPALAIAEILQETNAIQVSRDERHFKQVTPIQVEMGEEAFGVSAGYGEVKLTIRSWDNEVIQELADQCEQIAREAAKRHRLKVEVSWTQYFPANQNDEDMVDLIQRAAELNGFGYKHKKRPFRWGEDFGHFSKQFEGAMFGIGSGKKTPALHNPDYDFPEELILTGVSMFSTIIDELLKE